MDVVNELNVGPPAITSLEGSLTNTEEVNSSQQQKMAKKKKKQDNVIECEDPEFSLDNSSPEMGATTKHPLHEHLALPNLLCYQTIVELNSTQKNEKSKRQKTKHNAIESNVNGCCAPENTFSSEISEPALDVPLEFPVQCITTDSITRQSCVEASICQGCNEEKEKNMTNKTAENRNGQCDVQEVCCNNFLVVASPELFAEENGLEVVKLKIEQGINDNIPSPKDKSGFVKNTSLVKKNDDDPAVYDTSDKNQYVKTYSRRKNSDCRRNSGYSSPENCNKEQTKQDYHEDDSHKFSDGSPTVGLMDKETKLLSDQITLQSGVAAAEIKLRADNTHEQRFMTTSSVIDDPVEQLETNGRPLDHTEITRNDLCCAGDVSDLSLVTVKDGHSKISKFSLDRTVASNSKNKLLILDVNGLLADFVSDTWRYRPEPEPDFWLKRKKVYKRPFCDDFLQFCFDRFHVGVWSSRTKRNVDEAIKYLIGESASKLLFCWNQSHCTTTEFTTVENRNKPLVLKELRKLWEKAEPGLPWEKGEFNESNTLLLDDSPYKALMNPMHTAIFPYSYLYYDTTDSSLGPGGDLRVYLEGLAMADNVQEYVLANPFGQRPIRETNPSWVYYRKVIESVKNSQNAKSSSPGREPTAQNNV
ncbi:hypothetical protein VNO77_22533 [Canavalia gladiata]|uniref:FCP1 homology domain-containing protein n=1 Tax=Canavalia gladiata TaxID=3824 RepID=A0AAN9QAV9_CANGL